MQPRRECSRLRAPDPPPSQDHPECAWGGGLAGGARLTLRNKGRSRKRTGRRGLGDGGMGSRRSPRRQLPSLSPWTVAGEPFASGPALAHRGGSAGPTAASRPAPSGLPVSNPLGAVADPWRRRDAAGSAGQAPDAQRCRDPRPRRGNSAPAHSRPWEGDPSPEAAGGYATAGLGTTASGVTSTRSCERATDQGKATPLPNLLQSGEEGPSEGKATPLSILLQSEVKRDCAREGGFQGDRRRSLGCTPPLP